MDISYKSLSFLHLRDNLHDIFLEKGTSITSLYVDAISVRLGFYESLFFQKTHCPDKCQLTSWTGISRENSSGPDPLSQQRWNPNSQHNLWLARVSLHVIYWNTFANFLAKKWNSSDKIASLNYRKLIPLLNYTCNKR